MPALLIPSRFKALREERKLSQDDVARMLGFKDRQTISAIETGARQLSADEMLEVVRKFDAPLDYFIDPFRLEGEGRFSWRQEGVPTKQLRDYERKAGTWIAAYRELTSDVEHERTFLRRSLGLSRHSRFEDAMLAGSRFVNQFNLGNVPAERLAHAMEQELGVLVLLVDAPKGISGAACRLPELDTVLIARGEVEGRRNFDLAHELFHILTWETIPPDHLEDSRAIGGTRAERLADNFAGAVLMPVDELGPPGSWKSLGEKELIARLNEVADRLHVSSSALRWRLAALKELEQSVARSLDEDALRNNGRAVAEVPQPPLFSKPFAKTVARALVRGRVTMSTRRAAQLLDITIDDMYDLFEAHGVEVPYRL